MKFFIARGHYDDLCLVERLQHFEQQEAAAMHCERDDMIQQKR